MSADCRYRRPSLRTGIRCRPGAQPTPITFWLDVPYPGVQPLQLCCGGSDCAERNEAQCHVNDAEAMRAHVVAMPLLTGGTAVGSHQRHADACKCRWRFNGKMTGPTQIFCLRTPRTSRGGPAPTACPCLDYNWVSQAVQHVPGHRRLKHKIPVPP